VSRSSLEYLLADFNFRNTTSCSLCARAKAACKPFNTDGDGDQREFDLETRVTTNGNNKTPRCFTVVH